MRLNRVRVITEMAKRDISVCALSEKAGISKGTIAGIRAGRSCSQQTGEKLAAAIGVDVETLLEEVM